MDPMLAARLEQQRAKVSSTVSEESFDACDSFELDTKANQFSSCKCGFPTAAHQTKPRVTAIEHRARTAASAVKGPFPATADEACGNYGVDIFAFRFGDCKCGFPKADHNLSKPQPSQPKPLRSQVPAAAIPLQAAVNASTLGPVNPTAASQAAAAPTAARTESAACNNYRVDSTAARFGDCESGFPKMAHTSTFSTMQPPRRSLQHAKSAKFLSGEKPKSSKVWRILKPAPCSVVEGAFSVSPDLGREVKCQSKHSHCRPRRHLHLHH